MRDAGVGLEREVLQLWIKRDRDNRVQWGVDAPDERGEIEKDVSTQTVLLDDQEGRGRYNLGAFIMSRACQASDVLTY